MSAPQQVDPEKVLARLSQQVGGMVAELAIRDVALEARETRIAELERTVAERNADVARLQQALDLLRDQLAQAEAAAGKPDSDTTS